MDKAYVDLEALYRMTENETYFVTRAKTPMKYEVVETNYNINDLVGTLEIRPFALQAMPAGKSILKTCALLSSMMLRKKRLSSSLPTTSNSDRL